ncbi:MAG: hypothetical protein ACI4KF_06495 [Huintestinicola sp.]
MSETKWNLPRNRAKTLLIVEGNHEKEKLFERILSSFPEIDIKNEDIKVYKSNIYSLLNKIRNEYGDEWYEVDIDLPWLLTKDNQNEETLYKRDFNNIFMIFDYERHDPNFSESAIKTMLNYFSSIEEVGKLYVNYPMVESYLDLGKFPDDGYENRKVKASIQKGREYKNTITQTFVYKLIYFPIKVYEILTERFCADKNNSRLFVDKLLQINNLEEIDNIVDQMLTGYLSGENIVTFKNQLVYLIKERSFLEERKSYNEFIRYAFEQIIIHNVKKANKIQNGVYSIDENSIRECYGNLDDKKILDEQNRISTSTCEDMILVLNTSVFIVPDYNASLVF